MNEQLLNRTRWGGRTARYRENPGKALRIKDPISGTPKEFGQDLIYEAWLIHRFDPAVKDIRIGHSHLGDEFSPESLDCIQLDVAYADGSRLLESLTVLPASRRRIALLKAVAKSLGAASKARCRADVRASVQHVTNLRLLRQLMQLHLDARDLPELKRVVTASDNLQRGELDALLAGCDPATLDAGLGFLLHAGVIDMDIKEKAYGQATLISRR
jgi:hypothetical protein